MVKKISKKINESYINDLNLVNAIRHVQQLYNPDESFLKKLDELYELRFVLFDCDSLIKNMCYNIADKYDEYEYDEIIAIEKDISTVFEIYHTLRLDFTSFASALYKYNDKTALDTIRYINSNIPKIYGYKKDLDRLKKKYKD